MVQALCFTKCKGSQSQCESAEPYSFGVSELPDVTVVSSPRSVKVSSSSALNKLRLLIGPHAAQGQLSRDLCFRVRLDDSSGTVAAEQVVRLKVLRANARAVLLDDSESTLDSIRPVFVPDQGTDALKIAATNPNRFTYNLLAAADQDVQQSFTFPSQPSSLSCPGDWALSGANPVHVFDGDPSTAQDITPTATIQIETPSGMISQPLRAPSTEACRLRVNFRIPPTGKAWVQVGLQSRLLRSGDWPADSSESFFRLSTFDSQIEVGAPICPQGCPLTAPSSGSKSERRMAAKRC